jgi:hypothetical protein
MRENSKRSIDIKNKTDKFAYVGQPVGHPFASTFAGVTLHLSAFGGGRTHGGGLHVGFSTHVSQHCVTPSAFLSTRPFDASHVKTTARQAVVEQSVTGQS